MVYSEVSEYFLTNFLNFSQLNKSFLNFAKVANFAQFLENSKKK